jgi:hypothetical protein
MARLRDASAAAKRAAGTSYPVLDTMLEKGIPLTRMNYMDLAFPSGFPSPWTPWDEAHLPVIFRSKVSLSPPKKVAKTNFTRHNVITYAEAIRILDESEAPMRDAIERDLEILRGRVPVKSVQKILARLMVKVTAIRTAAFKKAFRHLRDNVR